MGYTGGKRLVGRGGGESHMEGAGGGAGRGSGGREGVGE